MHRRLSGASAVEIIILAAILLLAPAALAAETEFPNHITVTSAQEGQTRQVRIGVGKSMVLDLPGAARDVLVANPAVADAVVRTQRRSFVIAHKVGQTNIFFFAQDGRQLFTLDLEVVHDIKALQTMLDRLLPGSDIKVDSVGSAIVLSGTAVDALAADRAVKLAGQFISSDAGSSGGGGGGGDGGGGGILAGATTAVSDATASSGSGGSKIVNMIGIAGKDQIALKVTVAEMARTTLKQLGVDLNAATQLTTTTVLRFATLNPFSLTSIAPQSAAQLAYGNTGSNCGGNFPQFQLLNGQVDGDGPMTGNCIGPILRALERNGLMRTLAEPTLTAISGETASFLAGGSFPFPIAEDNGRVSIDFKEFGVKLDFTPVVLNEGRISLKIGSEVSELSNENSVNLGTYVIPGLKVRRTKSTVELPSGGSLALAGLIQEDTKQELNGFPGLKSLPVLGALFRSREFQNHETELVVIATPYIVNPTSRGNLARPDEGFAQPSDHEVTLLGRLNAVYGHNTGRRPQGQYQGAYGFIVK